MGARSPLTQPEKEQIYQAKLAGQSLQQIAGERGYSLGCVRKWWRRGRDEGLKGLQSRRQGRGPGGILSQFDPLVGEQALAHKRLHRRWGARRVLVELSQQFSQAGHPRRLPSASRLALFFKEQCPECVRSPNPVQLRPPWPRPPRAKAAHQIWQFDAQEGIKLADGDVVTLGNIRDEWGCAQIASQAFSVKTADHWRKLSWTEVQQVLRLGFIEWQTLPEAVLTDNELGLAGCPTDPYPSLLTLWLAGLAIKHLLIRAGCPEDQAHVERSHLTMDTFTWSEAALANRASFQQHLDQERFQHNHLFPSRAGDCAGRAPLVAHPELLKSPRPYRLEAELSLFSLQRVADYLATLSLTRKVSTTGQISLGRQIYSVGRPYAHQFVQVRFDPQDWLWLVTLGSEAQAASLSSQETILTRLPPKNFSVEAITGLDPVPDPCRQPLQLSFSCFIA